MKNKHAQVLGSLGGKATAKKLTKKQRIARAKKGGRPITKHLANCTPDTPCLKCINREKRLYGNVRGYIES